MAALTTKIYTDVSHVCARGIRHMQRRLPFLFGNYRFLSNFLCVCIDMWATLSDKIQTLVEVFSYCHQMLFNSDTKLL